MSDRMQCSQIICKGKKKKKDCIISDTAELSTAYGAIVIFINEIY